MVNDIEQNNNPNPIEAAPYRQTLNGKHYEDCDTMMKKQQASVLYISTEQDSCKQVSECKRSGMQAGCLLHDRVAPYGCIFMFVSVVMVSHVGGERSGVKAEVDEGREVDREDTDACIGILDCTGNYIVDTSP